MLCVADYLDTLAWVRSLGGQAATIARCRENLAVIETFVAAHGWIHFLASDSATRSNTSVCLLVELDDEKLNSMLRLLDEQGVAHDIGAYRDAPAGLRIWCGATIEKRDLELLMPWVEWAYRQSKEQC